MQKENSQIASHFLGPIGKMISSSKSAYRRQNPENLVVFNSNICAGNEKIWWGDIDITLSSEDLASLSATLNSEISVLSEMNGRFENEENPLIDNFVVRYLPDGTILKSEILEGYKF
jgi:hypothetical protein